ncbi:helix-turn-helix domain-containing protein [Candidatus Woesearchaeota archaeon]|nr:helix-turn-helix domain-containing protein [Candidatus Woesearchaeota archaeon]
MKQKPLEQIELFLLRKGFTVKSLARGCFDIVARKDSTIMLVKALEDANSISKENAEEMIAVSSYINASPLIVAEKAGARLEDNVVYSRFGIWTINAGTLQNCISSKFPFIRSTQAGFTASIKGEKLREKREESGYSLNSLSRLLGVSSRMTSRYETKDSEVTITRAIKIHRAFGNEVFNEINILEARAHPESRQQTDIAAKYVQLGFEATDTRKTPFNVIAKKDNEVILTEVGDRINPEAVSLSKLIEAGNLVIFKNKKPAKEVASMKKEEFLGFEKANELIRFLKEF